MRTSWQKSHRPEAQPGLPGRIRAKIVDRSQPGSARFSHRRNRHLAGCSGESVVPGVATGPFAYGLHILFDLLALGSFLAQRQISRLYAKVFPTKRTLLFTVAAPLLAAGLSLGTAEIICRLLKLPWRIHPEDPHPDARAYQHVARLLLEKFNRLNIKGTKTEEWGIAGVLRGGQGKPPRGARDFRKLMKITA